MNKPTRVAVIALIALLLLMMGLGAYAVLRVSRPDLAFSDLFKNRGETPPVQLSEPVAVIDTPPQETLPESTPGVTPNLGLDMPPSMPIPLDPALMGKRVNILALGYDTSAERRVSGDSGRTDTMMLFSIDTANYTVDIISLPRDSYVKLPNGSHNKINTAFSIFGSENKGGFQAACETVSWTLGGVPVDFYVGVDMNLFKQLVDAIGGVDYDVDLDIVMNGRELKPGYQHLDGQQVLDYCRFRHSGRGDIDRIDRQQRMVLTILDQAKSAGNLLRLPEIIRSVTDNLRTDLNLEQIGALAYMITDIPLEQIRRHTLPGVATTAFDVSYWLIRQKEKQAMIEEIFGVTVDIDMSEDVSSILARSRAEEEKLIPYSETIKQDELEPIGDASDPDALPHPEPALDETPPAEPPSDTVPELIP